MNALILRKTDINKAIEAEFENVKTDCDGRYFKIHTDKKLDTEKIENIMQLKNEIKIVPPEMNCEGDFYTYLYDIRH
jgi:hypothetical protein